MTELSVLRATSADTDTLVPLVEAYRAFYRLAPDDGTRQYVADRIGNDEAVVFIARMDGQAVGFTMIYPTFSTSTLTSIWLLNDLYVAEAARRNGIAGSLLEAAENAARDAGAARIWLRTAHGNAPAQALYEGRGWVEDKAFRRYDLIF